MSRGVKKINKTSGLHYPNKSIPGKLIVIPPNQAAIFQVIQWLPGTKEEDKKKTLTWMRMTTDKKEIISQLPSNTGYSLTLDKKLCGSYQYYIEASFSGKHDTLNDTGLYVRGECPSLIKTTKWSTTKGGNSIKNSNLDKWIKYGHIVHLNVGTEGLNGAKVTVEIFNRVRFGGGDKFIKDYSNIPVTGGEINLEIKDTFSWMSKVSNIREVEQFYIQIKNPSTGKYYPDHLGDIKHAIYLNVKDKIATTNTAPPTNHTPTTVYKPDVNAARYEPCRYDSVLVNDTEIYNYKKNITSLSYESLASSDNNSEDKVKLIFDGISTKKCFHSPNHTKEIEIYIDGIKQKTEKLNGNYHNLKIKANANKTLLKIAPEKFFFNIDLPVTYKTIVKTCAQPNQNINIYVYPNIEREVAFVLSLFKTFSLEVNPKFSSRESLTEYNKEKQLQLIRDQVEILYNTKGGLGFGLSAKVKIDNTESSIELGTTRSQIKKIVDFYYRVQEVLKPLDGTAVDNTLSKSIYPKVTFDIEPPNVALALRLSYKKIDKSNKVVLQYSGGIALKPIVKFKIGVDLLTLVQYMGVGGKIANWIKEKLEKKYNFTIYMIFEVSLEARGEMSLGWNKIEGFNSGSRKLQVEPAIALKGGVKSTEFITVILPEADGKPQKVNVEKWKGEAMGTASIVYTYEVKSDNSGPYKQHKLEFTGIKATIVIYALRDGMQYNETFKKVFTIMEKPEEPWYKSDKEHLNT